MERAVERLVAAVESLPCDLSNDEVVALFGVYDRPGARLTTAVDGLDPAADGAVSRRHWLRRQARRSDVDAGALVRRATRLRSCPT